MASDPHSRLWAVARRLHMVTDRDGLVQWECPEHWVIAELIGCCWYIEVRAYDVTGKLLTGGKATSKVAARRLASRLHARLHEETDHAE